MARPRLGNDPFKKGAAKREPAPPVEAPKAKASTKTTRKPKSAPNKAPTRKPKIAPVETVLETAPVLETPAAPIAPVATVVETMAPVTSAPIDAPHPRNGTHDAFGRDPSFAARALRLLEPIYRRYFRVETRGLENVPTTGPVILVANHCGALPWDVAMLSCATSLDHPAQRALRPLVEDFVFDFPVLGSALNRLGAVRSSTENAQALLAAGEAVAFFPEGEKGLGKSLSHRYRLAAFDRGSVIELAMRTGAPVVPVAIVGGDEVHPVLLRLVRPVAPLGLPFLPVTPTFPWLGALGLWPLPTKWTIEFGAPVRYEASGSIDASAVARHTEELRTNLQDRIDGLVRARRGIFG